MRTVNLLAGLCGVVGFVSFTILGFVTSDLFLVVLYGGCSIGMAVMAADQIGRALWSRDGDL